MTGLLQLPSELISEIASYLDTETLFSLRLSSKYLEQSCLSVFGRRFFRKKGFLITTRSISVLQAIASQEKLQKYVQHVWINPDCYTSSGPRCDPPNLYDESKEGDCTPSSKMDRRRWRAWHACTQDHATLIYTPHLLATLLKSAFKSLPNLTVLGMRRSEDHHAWGCKELKDAIGQDPRIVGSYPGAQDGLSGPTLLFIAFVNAVAEAKVSLKRLYTDAIEIDNIRDCYLPQRRLEQTFRDLLYLEVNVYRGRYSEEQTLDLLKCERKEEYGKGFLRFWKACKNLHEVGLQVFDGPMRRYMLPPTSNDLPDGLPPSRLDQFSWLQAYPHIAFQKLVENVQLHQLRRIKLEKMTTTPDTLQAFLSPSRGSLTSIKFRDFRLLSSDESGRPWQSVFTFLRDDCPDLLYILLNRLMYEGGTISFVEHPPLPVPYLEIQDPNDNPNVQYGEPVSDGFFSKYEHIALEASGRENVAAKLGSIVNQHWYQQPLFSYQMDEDLWHTDTSDEEW
ncbi:uncharacterized protein LTR77_008570 [Saxophila tyrrhenica]|uniref:F-box domain-containing protein n=1 Tax=Saxophila tyrrhenica TaxID=1690608 RepID=A0AAV9P1B2_9PEZI|nr:hypothetical protein LTR77_008570 [Saxophila tyrrhenica]